MKKSTANLIALAAAAGIAYLVWRWWQGRVTIDETGIRMRRPGAPVWQEPNAIDFGAVDEVPDVLWGIRREDASYATVNGETFDLPTRSR